MTKPMFTEELTPRADDLLFFADDTGHETFAGSQGFYGLGGCAVLGAGYDGVCAAKPVMHPTSGMSSAVFQS